MDENGIMFCRRMVREEQKRVGEVKSVEASVKQSGDQIAATSPQRCCKGAANLQDEIPENRQKSKIAYTEAEAEAEISSNADIKFIGFKIKNNDSRFKAKTQGSRLPENWAPTGQEREYAQNLGLDAQRVVNDFCDYWHSKAGKDATKLDWSRTWQRWCRQAKDWGKGNIRVFPARPQRPQLRPSNLTWMVEEHEQRWGGMQ